MITRIKESSSWAIRLVVDQAAIFIRITQWLERPLLCQPHFDKYGKSLEDGINLMYT